MLATILSSGLEAFKQLMKRKCGVLNNTKCVWCIFVVSGVLIFVFLSGKDKHEHFLLSFGKFEMGCYVS